MTDLIMYHDGVIGIDLKQLKQYADHFRLVDEEKNVLLDIDVSDFRNLKLDIKKDQLIDLKLLKEDTYLFYEHVFVYREKGQDGSFEQVKVRNELHLERDEKEKYLQAFANDIKEEKKNANKQ